MHAGPRLKAWVASVDRSPKPTIQAITDLNRRLHGEIKYEIRMEPGVQTPEETLERQNGSCRDSAWLLVQIFRHLGVAARFASGYLIQLAPDVKAIDGPSGPDEDFTDLHAWAEIYLPGAGWVGLDPTSGLLCGEGHLPLACTPEPSSAAPISGTVDQAECEFHFSMALDRIQEDPRSTKPYSEEQWHRIDGLGRTVDQQLETDDARLTFGGEPTFVSMDDMQGEEWNQAAVGPTKRQLSGELIKRLRQRFGPGGLLHYGQGKWYPGESLPRWALTCLWRLDGEPIWQDDQWIADESRNYGFTFVQARSFTEKLASHLGVDPRWMMPAYEDIYYYIWREQRLPINVAPWDPKLEDPEERARLARVFQRGLNQPVGVVLPIQRQWWQGSRTWQSGPWPVRPERLFLLPGDSSIGLRLPLDTLPWTSVDGAGMVIPQDPFAMRPSLPSNAEIRQQFGARSSRPTGAVKQGQPSSMAISPDEIPDHLSSASRGSDAGSDGVVRTALCVEPRDGRIYVFMPPTELLEDYLELTAAIEWTAKELRMPVVLEGYLPPRDHRVQMIKVTPDPGVIEVNVHPSRSWKDLVANTQGLYEDARQCRLATEKFDLDGKHTGTGGGNHIVMGGPTPWDSPFLRRPDLLRSCMSFWYNLPSLSSFFSNRFFGPTRPAR
ncbi:MAG: transglutaminase family protein, partial [Planctomycetota bacterium]